LGATPRDTHLGVLHGHQPVAAAVAGRDQVGHAARLQEGLVAHRGEEQLAEPPHLVQALPDDRGLGVIVGGVGSEGIDSLLVSNLLNPDPVDLLVPKTRCGLPSELDRNLGNATAVVSHELFKQRNRAALGEHSIIVVVATQHNHVVQHRAVDEQFNAWLHMASLRLSEVELGSLWPLGELIS
jgi:hypothetical protein